MTLDDLELLEFSENFAEFRRFDRQQLINRYCWESVVTHWIYL